jgi:hypothetical protein
VTWGRDNGWIAAATATGLGILVLAAAAGPVGILSESGRRFVFTPPPPPSVAPSAADGPPENLREATRDVEQTADLDWLGELVVWAILLVLAVGVFLLARHLWRERWRRPPEPAEVAFDVLPEGVVVDALRDDVDSQFTAVAGGTPRNGIVACWLRLEDVVGAAGLPRKPSETSTEFTVRILRALDLDPRAVGGLSRLYREARFSEHELDETARTAARSALQQLHSDLQELDARMSRHRAVG